MKPRMVADDERREVARGLRELEVCEFDGEFIDCGEVENALGLVSDDGAWYEAEGVTRLADLIEPSCDQERLLAIATMMAADSVRSAKQGISVSPVYILHAARDIAEACGETFGSIRNRELAKWGTSIVPKETIVDREALLALADELEEDACWEVQTPGDASGAWRLKDACDRIREACGEAGR